MLRISLLRKDVKNIIHLIGLLINSKLSLIKKYKKNEKKVIHSLSFRDFAPNGGKGGGSAVLSCQKILLGDTYDGYGKKYPLIYSFKEENKYSKKRESDLWDLWGGVKFAYKKCKREFNAVYITHDYATAFGLALMNKKYVYIHHLQGSRVEEKLNFGERLSFISKKIIQYCEKIAFKKAFCVCFPSNGAVDEFLNSKLTKVKKEDFVLGEVLYNTIYVKPEPEKVEGLTKDSNYLTFLSVGQLSFLKGMDRNVKFFENLLKETNQNIRYILVGRGVLQKEILSELTILADKYINFSFIHLPHTSYPQTLYLQQISDVYIMLHRKSIFDLATLEVMSLKKVAILSNTGGNVDFNKRNNIIMFEEEDYTKLVKDFLSSDLRALSFNNYYVYLAYFDNDNFVKSYHYIINSLLSPIVSVSDHSIYDFQQKIIRTYIEEKDNNKIIRVMEKEDYFNKFFIKNNDFSRTDLVYISWLIENKLIEKAKEYLKDYIKAYGFKDIHRLLVVGNLAYTMGYEDKDGKIKQASKIFDYINKYNKENTLFNLLKNKSIAIVGNSDSSLGKNKGEEIDSHDIVIRFNNYITEGFENDYGNKCDIWSRGLAVDMPSREDTFFKLIIIAADLRYFIIHNDETFDLLSNIVISEKKLHNCIISSDLTKDSNIKSPTTGLLTIWEIYKTIGLEKVDIYGFDFLKEKSDKCAMHYFKDRDLSETIRRTNGGRHNLPLESEFLRLLLTENL